MREGAFPLFTVKKQSAPLTWRRRSSTGTSGGFLKQEDLSESDYNRDEVSLFNESTLLERWRLVRDNQEFSFSLHRLTAGMAGSDSEEELDWPAG